VILYSHPLLGEGLARLLGGNDGLQVEQVRVDAETDVATALAGCPGAGCPDVVILERGVPIQPIDVLRAAPTALLIDVGLDAGPSWTIRREELSPQPDEILRAIRACVGHGRGRRRPRVAIPIATPAETTVPS
jgi:hypothetical protein